MDAAEVVHAIEAAWRDVPHPGDGVIFTAKSYDDEGIRNYFHSTSWRGHDVGNLRAHSSAFTFFTPEAFHYWLPAFLIAAITSPKEADVILQCIPWSVTGPHASERWLRFSPAQREAVSAYLRYQIEQFGSDSKDESEALSILECGR